jgi:predicted phage terminase large subunit-like protein
MALVAPTAADVRHVLVEGPSGFLATAPKHDRPEYEPSKRRLTWANGATATTYSAEEGERLRGPEHDAAYCDELATWADFTTWTNLLFGLRIGKNPQCCITTTPRPIKLIRELLSRDGKDVVVTRGRTIENEANLSPVFLSQVVARYQGTRLGRQELDGELIDDLPGALWTRGMIDARRVTKAPPLKRIVVSIDPAAKSTEGSDETGIIVAGLGEDKRGYVLEDLTGRYAPQAWAHKAIAAYRRWEADLIVAEVNNGGEMVGNTVRMVDPSAPFRAVHASRGKFIRAEPISALYEQGMISHVGEFAELEDQMCGFTADFDRGRDGSPDRLDALVWALTELKVKHEPAMPVFGTYSASVPRGSNSHLFGRWGRAAPEPEVATWSAPSTLVFGKQERR